MELREKLSKPVEYIREVRNRIEAQQQKQLFFDEQFQKMVENGNIDKAVELIFDETKNLNARIHKDLEPEELAQYCLEKCREVLEGRQAGNFSSAIEELKKEYELKEENGGE